MSSGTPDLPQDTVRQLARALRGLAYGSIQLIVHDARIVRIERLERIRLTGPPEAQTVTDGRPTTPLEARHATTEE